MGPNSPVTYMQLCFQLIVHTCTLTCVCYCSWHTGPWCSMEIFLCWLAQCFLHPCWPPPHTDHPITLNKPGEMAYHAMHPWSEMLPYRTGGEACSKQWLELPNIKLKWWQVSLRPPWLHLSSLQVLASVLPSVLSFLPSCGGVVNDALSLSLWTSCMKHGSEEWWTQQGIFVSDQPQIFRFPVFQPKAVDRDL